MLLHFVNVTPFHVKVLTSISPKLKSKSTGATGRENVVVKRIQGGLTKIFSHNPPCITFSTLLPGLHSLLPYFVI